MVLIIVLYPSFDSYEYVPAIDLLPVGLIVCRAHCNKAEL